MLSHWIERTLAGDQQAFALIFDQYKNLVYKTAYLILNDAHEADDALQETFL
jgi:DNA-directed RNA polymerase specialized sigma24 family protein